MYGNNERRHPDQEVASDTLENDVMMDCQLPLTPASCFSHPTGVVRAEQQVF